MPQAGRSTPAGRDDREGIDSGANVRPAHELGRIVPAQEGTGVRRLDQQGSHVDQFRRRHLPLIGMAGGAGNAAGAVAAVQVIHPKHQAQAQTLGQCHVLVPELFRGEPGARAVERSGPLPHAISRL